MEVVHDKLEEKIESICIGGRKKDGSTDWGPRMTLKYKILLQNCVHLLICFICYETFNHTI